MLDHRALVFFQIPNQWWIYYLGALMAGFLEAASLRLSVKRDVQVSEHKKNRKVDELDDWITRNTKSSIYPIIAVCNESPVPTV